MNRGEYLLKLIDDKGFTVMSLSKASGVAYTTLRSMLERNLNNASIDNVIKICKVLGIKVEDLNEENDYEDKIKLPSGEYGDNTSEPDIPLHDSISVIEYIDIDTILDDVAPQRMHMPRELLGKYSNHKNLVAIQVNSDEMNKAIPSGSYVIVKPIEYANVKDDEIVILKHNDECIMRRIRRIEEDKVVVFSPDSSDRRFRDIVVPYSNQSEFEVFAKVIWYSVFLG
ncbi:helix-turn-helix transcriptional regulator [Bacillus paranthracis]|uniref:XRE family transcriptional regulator n=1 Tax=Bacillus paranthracis TaxID=2026186 RepID=UPI00148EFBBD|nr:S24 family peptidase [Bacillus paranthracis]NOP79619.1 helix-turn-helix transcriptional regulator [Bacillus paranthracis]